MHHPPALTHLGHIGPWFRLLCSNLALRLPTAYGGGMVVGVGVTSGKGGVPSGGMVVGVGVTPGKGGVPSGGMVVG